MESDRLLLEGALVEGTADRGKREVELVIIREGFGNRRDNHYYGRGVLEGAATDFKNAKMYVDHLDPEAVKKLNGMPRSVKDIGGRITEAWIDKVEGQTVIKARAKIAQPWLWELIESDPDLLGVSINAWGKSKAGTVEGRQARIVEGISKIGSVDWVTEAGAGGKVVSLVEAQLEEEAEVEMETPVTDLTVEQLQEERPDLVDELVALLRESDDEDEETQADASQDADDDDADDGDDADDDGDDDGDDEDEEVTEADIEAYALQLAEAKLEEAVKAAVKVVMERYDGRIQEMEATHKREVGKVEQRYEAARIIEQAGFKPPTEKALKAEFFDVFFEGDDDKSPSEKLKEAVIAAIEEKRQELSAYTEARVTGTGETLSESSGDKPKPKRGPSVDKSIDAELGIE